MAENKTEKTQEQGKRLTMTDLPMEDRPRERALSDGNCQGLSKAELFGVLIGSGNATDTAVELCGKILRDYGNNIEKLAQSADMEELQRYNGIGPAKAVTILAALELGNRMRQDALHVKSESRITRSSDIYDVFADLRMIDTEQFWMLMLNRGNKIIKRVRLSDGGLSSTIVDVRKAMKEAILKSADAVVFCHNHPSGTVSPSKEDDNITERLVKAFRLMEMRVLDHVIIAGETYYSYNDNDRLIYN